MKFIFKPLDEKVNQWLAQVRLSNNFIKIEEYLGTLERKSAKQLIFVALLLIALSPLLIALITYSSHRRLQGKIALKKELIQDISYLVDGYKKFDRAKIILQNYTEDLNTQAISYKIKSAARGSYIEENLISIKSLKDSLRDDLVIFDADITFKEIDQKKLYGFFKNLVAQHRFIISGIQIYKRNDALEGRIHVTLPLLKKGNV